MPFFLTPDSQPVVAGDGNGCPCALADAATGIDALLLTTGSLEALAPVGAAPGPGDDDEDDEDPGTGSGGGGNIDPDDDDYAGEGEEDDDDEDPLWAAPAVQRQQIPGFAAVQHAML